MNCPCHSGKNYEDCCRPFHEGERLPSTALELMRSRYSAYALALVEYIIDTTHPKNSGYQKNRKKWVEEIFNFCQMTSFEDLKIESFVDGQESAQVRFRAILKQGERDVSFAETSQFEKVNGKWLYKSGE